MPLQPGQMLSHYRIVDKIGEGGMGEVWSATDTRLNRSAAIKALPVSVTDDVERLARFKREAQLLAALNHPNIAGIFGLEEIDGTPYLALELVEGEDLSERMGRGPVPLEEALEIATQIAAAFEEAHEKGIIHRDLKPANVKLGADGKIKVLDFGLAKALSRDPSASGSALDLSLSPTMTAAMGMGTEVGVILGTAAYMSPEQARGKVVDRRADIWAFGVILFEMLTGERLYTGETVTDVIAAVVTRQPDWDLLPEETPAATRRLLRRCLQKDPRRRLRDIGDAALELGEEAGEEPVRAAAAGPGSSRHVPWLAGVAGILLGLAAALLIRAFLSPAAGPPPLTWSTLPAPEGSPYQFTRFLEISPDGRRVVFVAPAPDDGGESLLWIRDLDTETARPLSGTEGAEQPFWSPDGRFIAYFAQLQLRRVSVDGGVSSPLADAGGAPRGGSWGEDGTILFVPDWSQPVFRIPASGGTPEPVTTFKRERLELSHRWPQHLPDGEHFLYYVVSTYPEMNPVNPSEIDQSGLYLGSLDGSEPRLLDRVRSRAAYRGGSLLLVEDGVLVARPFDLDRLEYRGESIALAEDVTQSVDALWGGALFSVSDEGTLLFVRGAPERRAISRFRWYDRQGNNVGGFGEPRSFNNLRISHDGKRVATSVGDPGDIWIYDLERNTSTRFTFDPGHDLYPLWSPDDDRIMFESARVIPDRPFTPGNLFQKLASGAEPEEYVDLGDFASMLVPNDWSKDGQTLLTNAMRTETGSDLMVYSLETGSLEPLLETDYDEENARFSPNERWFAYHSNESGRYEVYVRAFPGPGGKWQISEGGGVKPIWNADGTELFFLGGGALMSVPVETDGDFRHGAPVLLFETETEDYVSIVAYSYDVTPDGQRFLMLTGLDDAPAVPGTVTLLQGWRSLLAE